MATFYVDKANSKKRAWRLMVETYGDGKKKAQTVPRSTYAEFGFREDMSIDEARARARQLNAQNAVERKENETITRIAQRIKDDELYHLAFIPNDLNQKFLEHLDKHIRGSAAQLKARSRWVVVKKMIIELKLKPENYAEDRSQIYQFFEHKSRAYSPDYVKRLLTILNLYGKFVSKLGGKYYEKVPNPGRVDRGRINRAYVNKELYKGPSDGLTLEVLAILKPELKPRQHNWLFSSLWLGLRPREMDMVLDPKKAKKWYIEEQDGTDVLWVFQEKLKELGHAEDKCWKPIPLYYPEQNEAYAILLKAEADKPLNKTIQRHSPARCYLTKYCGRKGFTDLMLGRGRTIEEVAQWLGHTSIQTTWAIYKSRTKLRIVK